MLLKVFVILGSINAFISIALGAFAAHGLKDKLSAKMLEVFHTGVQYHMMHALGLILIGILSDKLAQTGMISWAGWLMFVGIILFSGSLYLLSTTGISKLGIITPFGGVAFILSWVLVMIAFIRA